MVKIVTDSTADLSKELIERYDIAVVPLHVHLGENEYRDGVDITPEEIYAWSDASKLTPMTAAPAITDVVEVYEKYPDTDIVAFSISESMSTSGNVMRLAAEETGREDHIFVINSQSLSTGIGLLVIEAAMLARNGATAAEIVKAIDALIPKVRASFVVDTLVYLHRGGRCSGVAALAGGALKLHPEILVSDGNMIPGKKYRGTMEKIITTYAQDRREGLLSARPDRVFITHSGCDDAIVKEVYSFLEELHYFDEILITRAGSVVSSHCGPGTLGVLFISK